MASDAVVVVVVVVVAVAAVAMAVYVALLGALTRAAVHDIRI